MKALFTIEKGDARTAAAEVLRVAGGSSGLRLRLLKGMPLASGLGSSGASAAAGAVAAGADGKPEVRCFTDFQQMAAALPGGPPPASPRPATHDR